MAYRVKNTFIDDFEDQPLTSPCARLSWLSRTCPPELGTPEPEAEPQFLKDREWEKAALAELEATQLDGRLFGLTPLTGSLTSSAEWEVPSYIGREVLPEFWSALEVTPPASTAPEPQAATEAVAADEVAAADEEELKKPAVRVAGTSCAPTPLRKGRGGQRRRQKLWCHLYLSEEMLAQGFELNKKVIGHGGCCTRGIFERTGAKLRLRGRGSKHFEGGREAPVPLQLAITAEKGELEAFSEAVRAAAEHLRDIERRYRAFCRQRRRREPEEECFWVGEAAPAAVACVAAAVEVF